MSEQKNWRQMLQQIGGWDNEFVPVPSGPVREMIEEIEALRAKLRQYEEAEKQEPIGEVTCVFQDGGQQVLWKQGVQPLPYSTKLYTRPAPIPEGYVLVPKEPTGNMLDAAEDATGGEISLDGLAEAYKAMLTAAEEGK